jgi:hypothetical protein
MMLEGLTKKRRKNPLRLYEKKEQKSFEAPHGTRESLSFPSAFLPRVHSSLALGEEWLPRVPDIWHSGKPVALGEFRFSCSGYMKR